MVADSNKTSTERSVQCEAIFSDQLEPIGEEPEIESRQNHASIGHHLFHDVDFVFVQPGTKEILSINTPDTITGLKGWVVHVE